jgi:glycine cleavage system aminomethyltransferase T
MSDAPARPAGRTLEEYREEYWKSQYEWQTPLFEGRTWVVGPAAAAQERRGAGRWSGVPPLMTPLVYTHWYEETLVPSLTGYIGDWSFLDKFVVKGPDAVAFLDFVGTNSHARLEPGRVIHHMECDENGKMASEGILYRTDEDEYVFMSGEGFWTKHVFDRGDWDADGRLITPDLFVFTVQGPQSLAALEQATGESLRDIGFNRTRMTTVAGASVRIARTGISGELGYELYGSPEHGSAVWDAVVEAALPLGMRQSGSLSQWVNNTEASFATVNIDYLSSSLGTPGQQPNVRSYVFNELLAVFGTYDVHSVSDLFKSPYELGWDDGRVNFDKGSDFLGRAALLAEKQAGGPAQTMTGLVWNAEDVLDVQASLLDPSRETIAPMELPRPMGNYEAHQVRVDGELVGHTASRVYSAATKRMISHAFLPPELTKPGTEVAVLYGDRRWGATKEIRASTVALPFRADRRRVDVSAL